MQGMTDLALAALARTDPRAEADLLARYERLCTGEAIGFFYPGHTRDDVHQEARLGLLYAIRDYDAARGPFLPFARLCVRRQLLTGLKMAQRGKHGLLSDSVRRQRDDDGGDHAIVDTIEDPHGDPSVALERREEIARLARGLATLTPLERRALVGHANGLTYAEIEGWASGKPKTIDNAIIRARRKLLRAA